MAEVRLDACQVPQADDLSRVVQYVREVGAGRVAPDVAGFVGRDAQYYAHAGRVLGLLDIDGRATPLGRDVIDAENPLVPLVGAFESTPLARAWALAEGVSSVWNVESNSAEGALKEVAELADSTAERRATTLRSWHDTLLPIAQAIPSPDALRNALLDTQLLDLVDLPTRLVNFARRQELSTVRDLVKFGPDGLADQPNLGRTSITEFNGLLTTRGTRETFKSLHAWLVGSNVAGVVATGATPLGWDDLRAQIPRGLASTPVSRIELPTRLANFCVRKGIVVVGDLVAITRSELFDEPNLGRGSIQDGFETLRDWLSSALIAIRDGSEGTGIEDSSEPPPFTLDIYPTYEAAFHAMTAKLEFRSRLILSRRSGLSGAMDKLSDLGEMLGVVRERVRQIEAKAIEQVLRDPRWAEAIVERLEDARAGEARDLRELADDPFFAPAAESPKQFRYLLERVLPTKLRLAKWEGGFVVSEVGSDAAEEAFLAFADFPRTGYPMTRSALEAEAHAAGEALGRGYGFLFVERVTDAFILDASGETVLGRGTNRIERVRAYLRERREPVRITDLESRFGRFHYSEELILVERGLVTVPENLPDFRVWQERLVPQCLRIMEERGPDLQWMATDLLEALAEVAQLPPYLTPWILSGMLRRSKQCDDLGRMRFALTGVGGEGRAQFVTTLAQILTDAGGPLTRDELRSRLAKTTTFLDSTFYLSLVRYPLVSIDDERVGLLDRDVPGGRVALEAAGAALEAELTRRERGLTVGESLQRVKILSPDHEDWTRSILAAVARFSPAIAVSRVGVGLTEWDDVRVPSRGEVLRRLVDDGDGAVSIDTALAALAARERAPIVRSIIYQLAYQLGLRVEDGQVLERNLAKSVPPPFAVPGATGAPRAQAPVVTRSDAPTAVLPNVDALGVPLVARDFVVALMREPVGDWSALLVSCEEHAAEMAKRHALNEFLPLDEARVLLDRARKLVPLARASSDPVVHVLVWTALRYFQMTDDGDSDFTIGGLDDDIAVLNAVLQHLGLQDLRIDLAV